MTKFDSKKMLITIGHHTRILLLGLRNTVIGTLTVGMFVMSIAGFWLVSRDKGYVAVLDFICSCIALAFAVASMYFQGSPRKSRGGRYVEK